MRPVQTANQISATLFQSTHPVWDATGGDGRLMLTPKISIHASRMGCDFAQRLGMQIAQISIHASRMGCDSSGLDCRRGMLFQSTHPVWDATPNNASVVTVKDISIHASRMGCDLRLTVQLCRSTNFNPRIPYGMRRSWHWPRPSSR